MAGRVVDCERPEQTVDGTMVLVDGGRAKKNDDVAKCEFSTKAPNLPMPSFERQILYGMFALSSV